MCTSLLHLLSSCPWVPEWFRERERKTAKYLTVHHCTNSECTIHITNEEDTSLLHTQDSHTHQKSQWPWTVSTWRESKCWWNSAIQNTSIPNDVTRESERPLSQPCMEGMVPCWVTVIGASFDRDWHGGNTHHYINTQSHSELFSKRQHVQHVLFASARRFCVLGMHVLPVPAWVFSISLPQFKNGLMRLIEDPKSPLGVSVWATVCAADWWPVQGVSLTVTQRWLRYTPAPPEPPHLTNFRTAV